MIGTMLRRVIERRRRWSEDAVVLALFDEESHSLSEIAWRAGMSRYRTRRTLQAMVAKGWVTWGWADADFHRMYRITSRTARCRP